MEEEPEVNGIYQQFGEVRRTALQLAIDSAEDFATDAVVDRAEAFFQFLTRDGGES